MLLAASAIAGCGGPTESSDPALFPKDLEQGGYVAVRACRSPGEHSGLGAFTVWVNPESRDSFDALWAIPPTATTMEAGAVIVKEVYAGTECTAADIDHWVAMKKEPGFDPDHGDWHWQEMRRDGTITVDGESSQCSDCHAGGADTTCAGYGAMNGKDYVCTAP